MKLKGLIVLLFAILLSACGNQTTQETSYESPTRQPEIAMDAEYYSEALPSDSVSENSTGVTEEADRSIIYTASVSLETITYAEAKEQLLDAIAGADGNVQYQDESAYQSRVYDVQGESLTQMYLLIRVPQANFESLLNALESIESAEVIQSSRGSEDVSSQVSDLEIRIASVETRIERLNELNEEAESVTDLIEIEAALQEAILQRDQLLAQQANLTDQVDLATITVSLREVIELSNRGGSQRTFWDDLQEAFVETWYRAIDAAQMGILSVVFLIPYLIFIVILIAIFRWIILPIIRLLRKNFSRKQNKTEEINNQSDNIDGDSENT